MKRLVTGVAAGSALALAWLATPASTSAAVAARPTMRVVGYQQVQRPTGNGSLHHFRKSNGQCVSLVGDDNGAAPNAYQVMPGRLRLRISLHTASKPKRFTLTSYPTHSDFMNDRHGAHPTAALVRTGGQWQVDATEQMAPGREAYLSLDLYAAGPCGGADHDGYLFRLASAIS